MDIISILQLFGGIGLFLFGMSQMSTSLEKLTGSGLERILERVTTSKKKGLGKFKGWSFGAGVTAILQSSAATTIMLVGFVNAGIMKVVQAMPVVFGANVGSTVTAQILRLGDISDDHILLQLIKPAQLCLILVGLGAFIIVFTKSKKAKNVAGIMVGLGMLFYGMTLMENVFAPLKDSARFKSFFTSFENPLIGILTGIIITVILQSSNASVGLLQTLSASGTITYGVAIPIIIGQNIGKCSTTIIGGLGGNKKAKRVVVGYVFFNVFGAVFFTLILCFLHYLLQHALMDQVVNRSSIATVHLLFNLVTSLILLPFSEKISDLTEKIVGKDEEKTTDKELAKLDDMLLNTPTIALEQCKDLITQMGEAILDNYRLATDMIYKYDEALLPKMEENEAFIDKCETVLSAYIVRIDRKRLTSDDKLTSYEILNSIGDFERMGDYCMNIAYVARDKNEMGIHFSPSGHKEVETMIEAVKYTVETAVNAFINDDISLAVRVEPLSQTIDRMKEIIKVHHVERLQEGICSIEGGVSLFDLVNSFERIASHAANVSLHVIKKVRKDSDFDEMHGHANDMHTEEYKALNRYYESQYIDPILVHQGDTSYETAIKAIDEKLEENEKTEKTVKEKTDKEKAAKEKAAKEKAAKEKAAKEKAEKEKTAKEKTAKEKAAKEKTAKEKNEKKKDVKSDDKKKKEVKTDKVKSDKKKQ